MNAAGNDSGERVRELAAQALERARSQGRDHWLCLRRDVFVPDLLALFAADEASPGECFYWARTDRDFSMIGFGAAHEIESGGALRFREAGAAVREFFDAHSLVEVDAQSASAHDKRCGPRLLGGFGFYDDPIHEGSQWLGFGPGRLVLPECLVVSEAGRQWSIVSLAVNPEDVEEQVAQQIERALIAAQQRLDPSPDPITRPTRSGFRCEIPSVDAGVLADASGHDTGPEYRVRADRSHSHYCGQVDAALDDIAAGKLSKVVLARSLRVEHDRPFALAPFLRSLGESYPSCVVVAVRRGARCFVSASPERLVALRGDRVDTGAVAGSAPRGRSPEEDERFARSLCESEKERAEHEVVKRIIRGALRDVCGELAGPPEPQLLRLEGIQHLETPLVGRLQSADCDDVGILELVERLHPTPAVGGAPSATAVEWLQRFEGLDRGWYAGPVGYVDAEGQGEFRVALRSGLIHRGEARLFAGAGIVAGSDPAAELAETRLKLRALLAPLTEI